jgi:hypothetical protein
MFVGHEVLLEVSFALARERLVRLTEDGALISASEDAYGRATDGLTRVAAAGLSKLVRVQLRELAWTDRSPGRAMTGFGSSSGTSSASRDTRGSRSRLPTVITR